MARIEVVDSQPTFLWRIQNDVVLSGMCITLGLLSLLCCYLLCKKRHLNKRVDKNI